MGTRIWSIEKEVYRILRDNLDLRTLDKREDVVYLVRKRYPQASFEGIIRSIRRIQNSFGLCLPNDIDPRFELATEYKTYYTLTSQVVQGDHPADTYSLVPFHFWDGGDLD